MSSNPDHAGPRHRAPSWWRRAFLWWSWRADFGEVIRLAWLENPGQFLPLAKS
ncbi:MAG: hypothetical protein JO115_15930 [Pseudonocardiales bacterium]|nr:hypothetical protein [Pseudonocardiales bacterium]